MTLATRKSKPTATAPATSSTLDMRDLFIITRAFESLHEGRFIPRLPHDSPSHEEARTVFEVLHRVHGDAPVDRQTLVTAGLATLPKYASENNPEGSLQHWTARAILRPVGACHESAFVPMAPADWLRLESAKLTDLAAWLTVPFAPSRRPMLGRFGLPAVVAAEIAARFALAELLDANGDFTRDAQQALAQAVALAVGACADGGALVRLACDDARPADVRVQACRRVAALGHAPASTEASSVLAALLQAREDAVRAALCDLMGSWIARS